MYKVCTGFLGKLADIMWPNQTVMKHISTFTLLLAMGLGAFTQSMPYNPDSNGDKFVGVDDVLSVLGVYNTALVDSSLTCDYEGTELENLFAGIFNQELVLDSVYMEYLLVDTGVLFNPGCPEPVETETVLQRSFMFHVELSTYPSESVVEKSISVNGFERWFRLSYDFSNGEFLLDLRDDEIAAFTDYNERSRVHFSLPFPPEMVLDTDGIQVQDWEEWYGEPWVPACSEFRLIPFWHSEE